MDIANTIVQLVQLGFIGFATALAFLSFILLRKLPTQNDAGVDIDVIRCKTNLLRLFMCLSLFFVIAGLCVELMNPKVSALLTVSPLEPYLPSDSYIIFVRDKQVASGEIILTDKDPIIIHLDKLYNDILDKERTIEIQTIAIESRDKTIETKRNFIELWDIVTVADVQDNIRRGEESDEAGI